MQAYVADHDCPAGMRLAEIGDPAQASPGQTRIAIAWTAIKQVSRKPPGRAGDRDADCHLQCGTRSTARRAATPTAIPHIQDCGHLSIRASVPSVRDAVRGRRGRADR